LATRVSAAKEVIQTEEATKNAMIMPFIQILGYNVFDPMEVTPELIADIGTKKGEKVDYAILKDGAPIMIFECKKAGADLHINHASQLFRYFHVTEARFAVLTNGLVYQFFTDLEQPNKMDEKPFFEFNILNFKERDVGELKKFAKPVFDIDSILTTASDLKYTKAIKNRIHEWLSNPPEEFVKLLTSDFIGNKRFTPTIKDQFTLITKHAAEILISDRINERLKGAMTPDFPSTKIKETEIKELAETSNELQIETTLEEIEGLHSIRAILRTLVNPKRIVMRDAQSYCAILLDDNNRKPLCRLRFNNSKNLRIGLFNDKKEELIENIQTVDDLFNFSEQLAATISAYINEQEKPT
jgi:hypothetical protein